MRATFVWDTDRGPETIRALAAMLEALTVINVDQVGELPDLYSAGIRYVSEVRRDSRRRSIGATELWCDARTVVKNRAGDCEDLSSYLAACLRVHGGIRARAIPFYVRPGLVHCVCVLPDGQIEDPSVVLGMQTTGQDFSPMVMDALRVIG